MLDRFKRAAKLCQSSTSAEAKLWQALRGRRLDRWKFRRQHPIGPYYADFCCTEARLVVEIDGRTHGQRVDRDAARDSYMSAHGLRVLRIPVRDISKQIDDVIELIARIAKERIEEQHSRLKQLLIAGDPFEQPSLGRR